jgi:hypothetical protein
MAHPQANGQVERANGLIFDGLKKRLYDDNSKKGGMWIDEISSVVWGLRTQPSKATRQSPFFLVYGSEAILLANVMWTLQDISNLTQLRKSDAMYCSSRPVTYKSFIVTTTGTFNDALSTLEIWFFDESRMILGYTSLTRNGKDLSLCTRLHALDLIAYSILMARRYQILGILIIYVIFTLDQLGTSSFDVWRLILLVQLRFTSSRLVLRISLLKGPCSHTTSI